MKALAMPRRAVSGPSPRGIQPPRAVAAPDRSTAKSNRPKTDPRREGTLPRAVGQQPATGTKPNQSIQAPKPANPPAPAQLQPPKDPMAKLNGILFETQVMPNNCGATAFANATKLLGKPVSQLDAMKAGLAPSRPAGVVPQQFETAAKNTGFAAKTLDSSQEFLNNAAQGKPQVMFGNVRVNGQSFGHCVTVAGSDQQGNLLVIDPIIGKPQKVPTAIFLSNALGGMRVG